MLAASGLLLPEAEAAERQHPAERILNDPRERQRKDRHRKGGNDKDRNRKDGNGKGGNDVGRNPNDPTDIRDIELTFYSGNTPTSPTYEIQVWEAGCQNKNSTCPYRLFWPRHPAPPVRQLEKFTGSEPNMVLVVQVGRTSRAAQARALLPSISAPRDPATEGRQPSGLTS